MLRAITLTQPWAGLVMSGIKLVENRPRPIIKNAEIVEAVERGVPLRIAIHASREIDESVYERVYEIAPWLRPEIDKGAPDWHRLSRVKSAILGTIEVTGALYIGGCNEAAIERALERVGMVDQLRFTFGPTVYTLARPLLLKAPVPCKGKLGFWKLSPDQLSQFRKAA